MFSSLMMTFFIFGLSPTQSLTGKGRARKPLSTSHQVRRRSSSPTLPQSSPLIAWSSGQGRVTVKAHCKSRHVTEPAKADVRRLDKAHGDAHSRALQHFAFTC